MFCPPQVSEYNDCYVGAAGRMQTYSNKQVPSSFIPLAPSTSEQHKQNASFDGAVL